MKLFPAENFTLQTTLNIDQAVSVIADRIKPAPRDFIWFQRGKGDFVGDVSRRGFEFKRVYLFSHISLMPIISGDFDACSSGTKVKVNIALDRKLAIFYSIYFLGILLLGIAFAYLPPQISGKAGYYFVISLQVLIIIIYAVAILCFKNEVSRARNFITEIFEPITPAPHRRRLPRPSP